MSFQMVPEYNPLGAILEAAARFLETYAVTRNAKRQQEADEAYRQETLDLSREELALRKKSQRASDELARDYFDLKELEYKELPERRKQELRDSAEAALEAMRGQAAEGFLEKPGEARTADQAMREDLIRLEASLRSSGGGGREGFTPGMLGLLGYLDQARTPQIDAMMTPEQQAAARQQAQPYERAYLEALKRAAATAGDSTTVGFIDDLLAPSPEGAPMPAAPEDKDARKKALKADIEKMKPEMSFWTRNFRTPQSSPLGQTVKDLEKTRSAYYDALVGKFGKATADSILAAP